MARLISDFVPDALAKGPYTAPSNIAEDAVRRTAIDLCERGGIWQHEFEVMLQVGVPDYPIFTPDLTRVVCVDWVLLNQQKYRTQRASLVCQCGNFGISIPNNKTILFTPTPYPACNEVATINLWLAPLQECCDLPDKLWQEYSDTIANGAAARMLQMPKQDYTNQGLAMKLDRMYEAGVTRAKNKRVFERTTGPLLMRGSYF